jgi:hypothetical protein
MANLHVYDDFDKWFDIVADIDPLSLDAPYRFTIGEYRLEARGRSIGDVLEWIREHANGEVHCLEPCESPEEDEHAIVFADVLDAAAFKLEWGDCDVDTPTAEERDRIAHGAAMVRKLRKDW